MVICLYYVLKFPSQIPYHNQSFIKYRKLQTLTKQNYYLDNSSDVCIKTVESDPSQITKSNSIQIDGSNHHEICWNFLKLSQAFHRKKRMNWICMLILCKICPSPKVLSMYIQKQILKTDPFQTCYYIYIMIVFLIAV